MARLRKAPASQTQLPPSTTRRVLKEKTNTAAVKSTAPRYEDDGNAETMIKDAKPRRGRPRKQMQQDSEDLLMAGAIGLSDEPAPPSNVPTTTDDLAKSDAAPAPIAKRNRRPPRTVRKVAQNEAQTKVLEGLKQRMAATAKGQRAKEATGLAASETVAPSSGSLPASLSARKASLRKSGELMAERSEFSLSPSPPPPGKLGAVKGKRSSSILPGSVFKVQSTPAVETSILALKNFKRRPRQPSMLAMVQQRTASARPSAVHTDLAVEDSSIFDLELDDEDDFAPEAEGTPFDAAKKKRKTTASAEVRAKRRKSTADDIQDDTEADRFVTADEVVVASRSSSQREESPPPVVASDAQTAIASSSSTSPTEPSLIDASHGAPATGVIVPSTEGDEMEEERNVLIPSTERSSRKVSGARSRGRRNGTIELDESDNDVPNGTMAEPISSSPAPEMPHNKLYNTDMADPVTQKSPVRVRSKRKKQKPASTATLQSLLPKRRKVLKPRQRKSEYDMASDSGVEEDLALDTSHLENDEDELGGVPRHHATPKARNNATKKARTSKKVAAPAAQPSTVARSRKASGPPLSKSRARTYGRVANSDKENDEAFEDFEDADESILPDVSISMRDATNGKEIEEAKRRFAEVDDWDMEFESMSQEDHRSSSQGWR